MAAMTFDPHASVKELELRLGSMMVVAIGSPLW